MVGDSLGIGISRCFGNADAEANERASCGRSRTNMPIMVMGDRKSAQ